MTDIEKLCEIMENLPGDANTTEEQDPEATGNRVMDETDIEDDLRRWRDAETEQVNREPAELGREIQHDG